MTAVGLQASLDSAIAPDDAYDLPENLDPPSETAPLAPPTSLCAHVDGRGPCQDAATTWVPIDAASGGEAHHEGYCDTHAAQLGKPRWRITDDNMASWALRKMGDAQREISGREAEIQTMYEAELERINRWRDVALGETRMGELRRNVAFFEGHLKRYIAEVRALERAQEKKKLTGTINLPSGTIKASRSQKLMVTNDEALGAWLLERSLMDLVKIEPRAGEVKKALHKDDDGVLQPKMPIAATGEIVDVPGVFIDVYDNITVTPA